MLGKLRQMATIGYLLCFVVCVEACLVACVPSTPEQASEQPVVIQEGVLFLHKSHIIGVKTSLYQPSFKLQGVVLANQPHHITMPQSGTLLEVSVHQAQRVDEGTSLLRFMPIWHPNDNPTKPEIVSINAPFDGKVYELHAKPHAYNPKGSILFSFGSGDTFEFSSLLPSKYADQLQLGQVVRFNLEHSLEPTTPQAAPTNHSHTTDGLPDKAYDFSGQIIAITPADEQQKMVVVHLQNHDDRLGHGVQLGGWVNYGDLTVGVLVPAYALVGAGNLDGLNTPPYRPTTPLPAHVWTIGQDGRVHLSPVDIIQYQPDSNRYLIEGISQDSLIIGAKLPNASEGAKVKLL